MDTTYELLDSGEGKKFERFGRYTLVRPASQAIGMPELEASSWKKADALFTREGAFRWEKGIDDAWIVEVAGIQFRLSTTDFGHLGVFPEQRDLWEWMASLLKKAKSARKNPVKVLNLFAYSGGATLIAAREGAEVCHLDASKGMVAWAKENAQLNCLDKAKVRWIVDDAKKFLLREIRRGVRYDAIILDPPTFGKGAQGQVFKFEKDLYPLLECCRELLSDHPLFLLLSCHTPQITPLSLRYLLLQLMKGRGGEVEEGEMLLTGKNGVYPLPNGVYARWTNES